VALLHKAAAQVLHMHTILRRSIQLVKREVLAEAVRRTFIQIQVEHQQKQLVDPELAMEMQVVAVPLAVERNLVAVVAVPVLLAVLAVLENQELVVTAEAEQMRFQHG
jgi:hypothetical protein